MSLRDRNSIAFSSSTLTSVLAILLLAGCLGTGASKDPKATPTPTPDPVEKACSALESQTFAAAQIKGGHHLYFNSSLLTFLDRPGFRVESIDLELTLAPSSGKKSAGSSGKGSANEKTNGKEVADAVEKWLKDWLEQLKKQKCKSNNGQGNGASKKECEDVAAGSSGSSGSNGNSGNGNGNAGNNGNSGSGNSGNGNGNGNAGNGNSGSGNNGNAGGNSADAKANAALAKEKKDERKSKSSGTVASDKHEKPDTSDRFKSESRVVLVTLNGTILTGLREALETPSDDKKVLHLHKMKVNGLLPFTSFMAKIRRHKGEVRLSLHGKDLHVTAANLVISGRSDANCATPTPTPAPVAPNTTLVSYQPTEAVSGHTTAQFEFTADQTGVNFSCSLDGGDFATCASPAVYSGLGSGSHVFRVKSSNAAGLESNTVEHSWMVDATAPSVQLDSVPSPTRDTSALITFTGDEPGAFLCTLDGGSDFPCEAPLRLNGLGEGVHVFTVTLVDLVGNRGEPARIEWRVDTQAPTVQIESSSPDASPSSSLTREVTFSADESSSFECSLDGSTFAACESPLAMSALGDGWHNLQIRATDAAGNLGNAASTAWETDTIAPTLSLGSVLPAEGRTNAESFQVDMTASEPVSFFCSFDGGAEEACASPVRSNFASDGQHSVAIHAVDLAGLKSAVSTVTWNVDRTAPEIAFESIAPSAAGLVSTTFIEATVSSPEETTLQASLDSGAFAPVTGSVVRFSALAEGSHTLRVKGTDAFGNATNTITHTFTVDRTAPVLQLAAELSGVVTNKSSNTLTFSANEPGTFECELDGAGFSACTSALVVAGLGEGAHEVRIRAKDTAGNPSAVGSVKWTIDLSPPSTSVVATQSAPMAYTFSFASNEAGATFKCSFDGAAPTACVSPVVKSNLSSGSHTFDVWATDPAGNADPNGAHTGIAIEEPLRTILNDPGVILTNKQTITFTFSSNLSDVMFLCSLDGAAPEFCSSPMTYTGLADGSHTFTVRAIDQYENIDPNPQSHTWSVDTKSPVILTATTTSTSTTISVQWTTNEPATAKLNWGIGTDLSRSTTETSYATSHSIMLNGLTPNTVHSIQVTGRDAAGNIYLGPKQQIRTRF